MTDKIPGIVIAAASSGSGKTTVSCGLMKALKEKGKKVAACKCGPDYIDPMFHREVLGIESENLDLFFCEETRLKERFEHHATGADIAVVEGVMGYYDGMGLDSVKGSSYDVARVLGLPVVLVIPGRGMASTILAVIKGMIEFRKDSNVQGIILNQISGMLFPKMKEMIESGLKKMGHEGKVLGYVPTDETFALESRHLGLLLPGEVRELKEKMERSAQILSDTVDLDALLVLAGRTDFHLEKREHKEPWEKPVRFPAGGSLRIGFARDEAFGFYYKDNLEMLEKLGCELIPFSPVHDKGIPEKLDGLLLGGGYPEVYAAQLSENAGMREEIREKIRQGLPCIAECGGFLYLLDEMEGTDGVVRPMAGVLQGRAVKKERLVRFGYVEIHAVGEGNYLKPGEVIRGHEFHYWDTDNNGENCRAVKPDGVRSWMAIHMEGNLFAGFPHLYWYSHPEFVVRFVKMCERVRQKKDETRVDKRAD